MAVATYDPKKVIVILGAAIMTGFGEGTFISFVFEEDAFKKSVGADGEVSRTKSNNETGLLKATIKQTSPTNDILSGYYTLDRASNSGVFPIMIKEGGSGRTLFAAEAAWVKKLPDLVYSKNEEHREWSIDVSNVIAFVGGNAPVAI